jgi:uncharacterized protein (DUF488 family)
MKAIMILGMSNSLRGILKNEADELRCRLENMVYDMYITETNLSLEDIDIRKIDNDLGYISLDIFEQKDFSILKEYGKLLEKYEKQLKRFYINP